MRTLRYKSVLLGCLAIGVAGFTLTTAWFAGGWDDDPAPLPHSDSLRPVSVREGRPIYQYSVIGGGVYSRGEVAAKMHNDPVVAAHYQGLDPGRLALRSTGTALLRHVSFRKGNAVFWTRRRLAIPAGEAILSDAGTEIRARCGNRMSETPQRPTLPPGVPEPDESELTTVTGSTAPDHPQAVPQDPQRMQTASRGLATNPTAPAGLTLAPPTRMAAPWSSGGPPPWYTPGGPGLYTWPQTATPDGGGPTTPLPPAELMGGPTEVAQPPADVTAVLRPPSFLTFIEPAPVSPVAPANLAGSEPQPAPGHQGSPPSTPAGVTDPAPQPPPLVISADPPSVPLGPPPGPGPEPPGTDEPDPPNTYVPEPATAMMVATGACLLAAVRLWKHRLSRS